MGRTKLDNRIRTLVENGVKMRHRSMFAVIGDKAKDQVVILHHILSKATVSARPSVLWCYKKELGFSSNRKKRMKKIQENIKAGTMHAREDDPFELFVSSTQVRYCYYSESHKILGNTFGMLVLQDFEALTPNLLARTVETVEGGGLVIFLLQSVNSLRQLYTLTMDVHSRYRTEAHTDIVARFNERFILSLASCKSCVVMDDTLNVLPISSHISKLEALPTSVTNELSAHARELKELQIAMEDTKPIGPLIKRCKTLCQAKTLLKLLDVITEKTLDTTCSVTAARGRGKSAALGLAIAGAIGFGFTNIFVTSPSPENLKTLFEFVVKGLEAMDYQEHADFEILKSSDPDMNKSVVRINVIRDHRQVIQYLKPTEAEKLGQAELVVIDEAAAIPTPIVRKLISGRYMVFLASTTSGYEGTGRSLSLKLLEELKQRSSLNKNKNESRSGEPDKAVSSARKLHELKLEESIRYNQGDNVEQWLNKLLCLDSVSPRSNITGTPSPEHCELYYVNRDTLFSFHQGSESFLSNLVAIYVSAHYKNSPNDLQMLSDAPAHHVFVLMPPVQKDDTKVPQILAVVQMCLEGSLSKKSATDGLEKGKRAAGDLIPWTLSQQFLDNDFPTLVGARIVRVAVHPDFQGMGYGSRAMQLVHQYYNGEFYSVNGNNASMDTEMNIVTGKEETDEFVLLDEEIEPKKNLPPLLLRLAERPAEQLDYIGVSFGLTIGLLKFWKRLKYVPVYLRQTTNDLTGEHTCIMLKMFAGDVGQTSKSDGTWLPAYFREFRHRFIPSLGFSFCSFLPHTVLSLLDEKVALANTVAENKFLSREDLRLFLPDPDLKRISQFSRSMADKSLIMDLLPVIANIYFGRRVDLDLDYRQAAVLLCVGLQRKTVEKAAEELDLPVNQTYSFLFKGLHRLSAHFDTICKQAIEAQIMPASRTERMDSMLNEMEPTAKSLEEDLRDAEREIKERQARDKKNLKKELGAKLINEFAIRVDDDEWQDAVGKINLTQAKSGIISVKSNREAKPSPISLMEDEKRTQRKRKRQKSKN